MGTPELSPSDHGHLLTDGIYGRVRNPRYIEVLATLFEQSCALAADVLQIVT